MRAITEVEVRSSLINADGEDPQAVGIPVDFLVADWEHLDFFAWRDPKVATRGYISLERDSELLSVVVRITNPGRERAGICSICQTMQPGNQVAMVSALRPGERGRHGDTVGTYMCADLSCHENARLPRPLAPNEIRSESQASLRTDGTRRRMESFVENVRDSGAHLLT